MGTRSNTGLSARGHATLLILHDGHLSARCRFGEETFLEAGYSVLVVSRHGYGRTASMLDRRRLSSLFAWKACVVCPVSRRDAAKPDACRGSYAHPHVVAGEGSDHTAEAIQSFIRL